MFHLLNRGLRQSPSSRKFLFSAFTRMASTTLDTATFYNTLTSNGVGFYCGVPDSLLKSFCAYITDHVPAERHVITANEGCAVALAAGQYLATGQIGCVYLQNSGLGNTVNPLLSLCHTDVYGLPVLMIIGWRGEPGTKDEPQHVAQGKLTVPTLQSLGIPYAVLPADVAGMEKCIKDACATMQKTKMPFAIVVKKETFGDYKLKTKDAAPAAYEMNREDAIKVVLDGLNDNDVVVSTTGMASREVFEHRAEKKQGHARDFLTVGCMGHAISIAMGISLGQHGSPSPSSAKGRQVFCLDGDGAAIMHMGTSTTVGQLAKTTKGLANLKHIVINNGAHDSVGGQPTAAYSCDLTGIARDAGYTTVLSPAVTTKAQLAETVKALRAAPGPAFVEVRVKKGNRANLGRPTTTPVQNRDAFVEFLRK